MEEKVGSPSGCPAALGSALYWVSHLFGVPYPVGKLDAILSKCSTFGAANSGRGGDFHTSARTLQEPSIDAALTACGFNMIGYAIQVARPENSIRKDARSWKLWCPGVLFGPPPLETVTLGEAKPGCCENGLNRLSVPPKSVLFCNPLLVTLYSSATREKLQMPSKLL